MLETISPYRFPSGDIINIVDEHQLSISTWTSYLTRKEFIALASGKGERVGWFETELIATQN